MLFLIDTRIRRLYERLRFNFKIQYDYSPAPSKGTCVREKRTIYEENYLKRELFTKLKENREHNFKANFMIFMA